MSGFLGKLRGGPVMVDTQIDLLPEDPTAGFHKDNPESREAFDELVPHLSSLQYRILMHAETSTAGITVKHIRYDLNLQHQTASARLTEMKKAGLLAPTDRRSEGCRVLAITDLGKRALLQWPK